MELEFVLYVKIKVDVFGCEMFYLRVIFVSVEIIYIY